MVDAQKGMNWLLAAALLLGVNVAPAMRHSHAGGGEDHHHVGRVTIGHRCEDHDCPIDRNHNVQERREADQPLAIESHCHLNWFGFAFTFPAPPSDTDDIDVETFYQIGEKVRVVSPTSVFSPHPLELPNALSFPAAVIDGDSAKSTYPVMPPHPSLCDAARRACSGVLLI